MAAVTLNLQDDYRIEQGSPFKVKITCKDALGALYSLVESTCAAQIRPYVESEDKISFTVSINTATSEITLSLSSTALDDITYEAGVWDCELTESNGDVIRLVEGDVEISLNVTR